MISEHAIALKVGYQLKEYLVESVLGEGGFGITYLARQTVLNKQFAIKEFLPREIATRTDGITVRPISSKSADDFAYGLDRFIKEARLLASFRHPNIVQVQHFFEANGTAYLVMDYEEGESLSVILKQHGTLDESELREILFPLLDGLAEVHKSGVLHRDIKPGNIFIRHDGAPLLLDFGAARNALGAHSRSLTSIVTPGYAPYEQYYGSGEQGPPTDIYALGATLYSAVTGDRPPEAPSRLRNDTLKLSVDEGKDRYSADFLSAIDAALAVDAENRPKDVLAWRKMFDSAQDSAEAKSTTGPSARTLVPDGHKDKPAKPTPVERTPSGAIKDPRERNKRIIVWGLVTVLLAAVLVGGGVYVYQSQKDAEQVAQVNSLLTAAQSDIDAGRLTRPPDSNAFVKFRRALDLDPGNTAAKRGLGRIVALLVARADTLTAQRKFSEARVELAEADRVLPGDKAIKDASARLDQARKDATTEANRAKVKGLVQEADNAIRRRDFDRAEARLKEADRILPESPDIKAARARLAAARGRAEAEERVRKLVTEADQAIKRRDFEAAQRRLDEAARLLPNSQRVRDGKARLASARQAATAADRAKVRRLVRDADSAIRRRDFGRAKARLDEANRTIPRHPDVQAARQRLAAAIQEDQRRRAADAKIKELVRSANAAIARKDFNRAKSLLDEADRLVPRHPLVQAARARYAAATQAATDSQVRQLIRQADAAIARRQFDRAQSLLDQAARINPRHSALGGAKRRLAAAKTAAATAQADAQIRDLIRQANAAIARKDFNRAQALLDQAARLNPRNRLLPSARRRLAAAKTASATAQSDAQIRGLIRQADAAIARKDFNRAQALVDQAARLNPRNRSLSPARRRLAAAKAAASGQATDTQIRDLIRQADAAIAAKQFDRAQSLLSQAARLNRRHRALPAARRRLAKARRSYDNQIADSQIRDLIVRADQAIRRRSFAEAKRYLDQAARIRRRSPAVREARRRLARAQGQVATATVACGTSVRALNRYYAARSDCAFVRRTFQATLSRPIVGKVSRWRNSRTGVSGTIMVIRTFQAANGQYCRSFRQTVAVRGRVTQGVGTACLRNNVWRLAGS